MSGLSIRLDRFGVGVSQIPAERLYPQHQKNTEEALTQIFHEHVPDAPTEKFPIRIELKPGAPHLKIGSREIPLTKSQELKDLNRYMRYYQHTGHLPRPSLLPSEESAKRAETRKAVKAMNGGSIPGSNENILAGMRVADDSLSLTRNLMYAIPTFGPHDPVANHLGYYAGMLWTFFAFREIDEGLTEYERSLQIGDEEGRRRACAKLFSGGIVGTGSLAFLVGRMSDTFALASAASALLSTSGILFGAGSILSMGASVLGTVRCYKFHQRLNEYLDNSNLTIQEKMRGALHFLQDSISVTPEEKAEVAALIEREHPDWSIEAKERFLSQKLADLTEVKVKYMKRRTSNKSLRLILEQSDPILAKLNDPKQMQAALQEAAVLIHTIQRENKVKMSLYLLSLVAALLSFVALVLTLTLSLGAVPFALYGISGAIYLAVTIYSVAGMSSKKKQKLEGAESLESIPLQNFSHSSM